MNTVVDPGITFFWLFSTEFRGPVCLTDKNLNSIEKWIPRAQSKSRRVHDLLPSITQLLFFL